MAQKTIDFYSLNRQLANELEEYWPLNVRQVFYQLLNHGIENERGEYQRASKALSYLRINNLLPWSAITDNLRLVQKVTTHVDASSYVADTSETVLARYRRDPWQTQPWGVEVVVEKNALGGVFLNPIIKYRVHFLAQRGFISTSAAKDMSDRIRARWERGVRTAILTFGDFDPSGEEIPKSLVTKLIEEVDTPPEAFVQERCGLTREQIDLFNLPHNPKALKLKDSRAPKFIVRNGFISVELDAVPPKELQKLVSESIERYIDRDKWDRELRLEVEEKPKIERVRAKLLKLLENEINNWD